MHQNDNNVAAGIEREFRFALQALAVNPEAQIAALAPGCITCDLYNDFTAYQAPFLDNFADSLTEAQREQIGTVRDALESIPDKDYECFDNDVLERQSWQDMRSIARDTLEKMGWELEPPPGFQETEPGVWCRP